MWLVLISKSGGYVVHSWHKNKTAAEEWKKCKEHDGDQVALAEIPAAYLVDLADDLDKINTKAKP
jgi:hypothetical protein